MKTLLVVDIQPEYKDYIHFLPDFIKYVNRTKNNVVFLYNGADTLGMIAEPDYQEWLNEKGVRDNVIYNATFYDKGYAFFRYCIDSNIDTESIVNLVKFMHEQGVNDSREQTKEFWDEYVLRYGNQDLRELLEHSDDMVYMPELMDFLTNYDDIILCGGGNEQCLKEVEICLMALGKKYKRLEQYIYNNGGNIGEQFTLTEQEQKELVKHIKRMDIANKGLKKWKELGKPDDKLDYKWFSAYPKYRDWKLKIRKKYVGKDGNTNYKIEKYLATYKANNKDKFLLGGNINQFIYEIGGL